MTHKQKLLQKEVKRYNSRLNELNDQMGLHYAAIATLNNLEYPTSGIDVSHYYLEFGIRGIRRDDGSGYDVGYRYDWND